MQPYRRDLKLLARALRKDMTDTEHVLWRHLRRRQLLGMQFYRQKPILDFIVDFYCPQARLVIELDGGQHGEREYKVRDVLRDQRLVSLGLTVLRFDNRQVLQETEQVVSAIHHRMIANAGVMA